MPFPCKAIVNSGQMGLGACQTAGRRRFVCFAVVRIDAARIDSGIFFFSFWRRTAKLPFYWAASVHYRKPVPIPKWHLSAPAPPSVITFGGQSGDLAQRQSSPQPGCAPLTRIRRRRPFPPRCGLGRSRNRPPLDGHDLRLGVIIGHAG